jgi:Zn-finger nucleic acid-binding protein
MSADAATLHCPNCGAVADPNAGRCPYCQARLATVSCPDCFALLFDGAAFCPKCGAHRERVDSGQASGTCPGCRKSLQIVQLGATTLLECLSCDGVWVDAQAFERLCANREAQAAVLHHFPARPPAPVNTEVRYRPCVRCQKMMNRVNFGRLSGAVVDVCKGHGTFLDAGELNQIVAFIQSGGLERARAYRVEELRAEERRLKDLQTRAMLDRSAASHHGGLGSDPIDVGALFDVIDLIRGD